MGYEQEIPEDIKTLLFDPQTAGGLLVSVTSGKSADLMRSLVNAGVAAVEIGEVLARDRHPLISCESMIC